MKKLYVYEIAAVNINVKKTCKSNKRDLNRDWIKEVEQSRLNHTLMRKEAEQKADTGKLTIFATPKVVLVNYSTLLQMHYFSNRFGNEQNC